MGAPIADGQGVGTILNDDVAGPTPSISVTDVSIAEGNSRGTTLTFTLTLSSPASGPISHPVRARQDGTAVAPGRLHSQGPHHA